MEGGYGNRGSSFSQSRRGRGRGRGQRFPSNQSKVSSFAERGTPSSSSANRASASVISNTQEDDAQPSSNFVGTCPYMCPERERIQREKLRDLAIFERLHGNPGKSSPALAVKKFCRTISTKYVQASDMRPITVLEDTLNYLLSLLESKEHLFEVVHDFVFDRTRSIRQDITMQNIVNKKAIYMYEGMVKFHVVSHYKLWCSMSDPNTASLHHLNMEQLTKTLASLFNLYEANQNSNHVHENEAEFHSLYVLLHLGSYSQPMGEPLSLWFQRVSTPVLKSKEMCFARRILRSFRLGNYKDFFCTAAAQASYLQFCIMMPYINEVRVLALSCINFGGYKLHPYPLLDLSKLLFIKESDLESFCNHCGLETGTDESGNKLLPTKQTTFSHPKGGFQRYSFLGLQEYER
ncbi:SAC3 family protein C-like [Glycine soja]|uniref:80 kDa MCM3-associated protein n=2 Tax=Glycine subgen. Soja TaxID=1462606 RepID=A0A0B2PLU1_GLYSO|nr:SAC3 family protein C-like [Glycine soja]KHN10331.1 80 kDa MCM3-associated protein [Glycine soja]RZB81750.1 SAC3 family protein C isoform A [Glycine soja]